MGAKTRVGMLAGLLLVLSTGCAASRYVTPSGPVDMSVFTGNDAGTGQDPIAARFARQPVASFPTTIAIARVQAPGYRSHSTRGRGKGAYSVVTSREIETEGDLRRVASMPQVSDVAMMNGLIVPSRHVDDRGLRQAAAALQAGLLLIYTVDTNFRVANTVEPLGVLTLGLFPSKEARVDTTISALLMDTRSGYVYALAEASAKHDQIANAWTSREAVDQSRRKAEREAFEMLIDDFERAWGGVVATYGGPT